MDIKGALQELEKSTVFKSFKKNNKNHFLSYGFIVIDHEDKDVWQLGYTDKDSKKVHTFLVGHSHVKEEGDFDIFKKPETKVMPLDLSKVQTTVEQALKEALEFQKKNYPQDSPLKIITIVQTLEDLGTIWNITFLTQTFKTLNIKLDANTLEMKENSIKALIDFDKSLDQEKIRKK